ncbi:spermine/spermidine synthase [Acidovorax sp. 100]|uniref:spermidine synthase n=1 Tax=Acidovorax sp. 100 TaxID=2135635 RepID=UPI000EF9EEDC|nr:hypothetical protein [Acidovorax sp. 100]RMA59566.1 spermine/spermidine synthase [Acidovorax sp. 100]
MNYPAILSFFCGFISLSLEILWVRLYGFAMLSTPKAFGFVLMAYLAGIALGAWQGGKVCKKTTDRLVLWRHSVAALAISAVLTLINPVIFVWAQNQWWRNPVFDFLMIASVSYVLAYIFPIAHHLGAGFSAKKQGQRFADVYTSNVVGASLGPLVVGYVILNYLTLQQAFVCVALLQLSVIGIFYWVQRVGVFRAAILVGCLLVSAAFVVLSSRFDSHALVQKINNNKLVATQVVENRHGIITIFPGDGEKKLIGDDAVYGGNVYDGRTNLSIKENTNGLHRPLLLAALQPKPKKVLMVGLSIGSWLALVNGMPGVEKIDVVEINDGYLRAIKPYPIQANALQDPRVRIIVDDARRWLRLHQEESYDVIIMNTTWHWRANAGFLLSQEFFQLVKKHMASGAVMAFNATGSPDAFFTATHVFNHAYRYDNFIYAADFDFRYRKDNDDAKKIYSSIKIEDKKLFVDDGLIVDLLSKKFVTIEHDAKNLERPLEIILDNNGITEFKYGYPLSHLY